MVQQKKIFTVQNLAEKFKQAKALVLADYRGLSVTQINELRREIKKTGAEFEVVKNSLLCLAAKNSKSEIRNPQFELTGPTAALWIYQEDTAALKTLDNFIQKTDLPKIKLGFWQGEQISLARIKELANLPGLNDLRAKLVGLLQSPIAGLNNALSWNMRKLILTLKIRN